MKNYEIENFVENTIRFLFDLPKVEQSEPRRFVPPPLADSTPQPVAEEGSSDTEGVCGEDSCPEGKTAEGSEMSSPVVLLQNGVVNPVGTLPQKKAPAPNRNPLQFSPDPLINGIIVAELLSKPVSMRRSPR